jgi:hypothetical protein
MLDRISSIAIAFVALLGLLVTGCGARLVPFTHELRVQNNLSNDDLKNLQYYVSHRITLRRELESGGSQVTGSHKLLVVLGKTIEEVVVEEHTPGVALKVDGRSMAVSFEPGTSLLFVVGTEPGTQSVSPDQFASPPDPFPGNSPQREPDPFPATGGGEVGGSFWLATGSGGRVSFQGKVFAAVEESLQAHLLIDAESLEEVVENRKVLPGVRLPSR